MAPETAAETEAAEWAAAEMAVLEDEIEAWKAEQLREMSTLFPLYSPDWARDIVEGADWPNRLSSCFLMCVPYIVED
jgi:hypothetical protein